MKKQQFWGFTILDALQLHSYFRKLRKILTDHANQYYIYSKITLSTDDFSTKYIANKIQWEKKNPNNNSK